MVVIFRWSPKWAHCKACHEAHPPKRYFEKLPNAVVTAVVLYELSNVFRALFDIKMFEIEPSKLRAPIDNRSGRILIHGTPVG